MTLVEAVREPTDDDTASRDLALQSERLRAARVAAKVRERVELEKARLWLEHERQELAEAAAQQRQAEEDARQAALVAATTLEAERVQSLRMELEVKRRVDQEKSVIMHQMELEKERQKLLDLERQRQQAQEEAARVAAQAARDDELKAEQRVVEVRQRVDAEKRRLQEEFKLQLQADAEAERRRTIEEQAARAELDLQRAAIEDQRRLDQAAFEVAQRVAAEKRRLQDELARKAQEALITAQQRGLEEAAALEKLEAANAAEAEALRQRRIKHDVAQRVDEEKRRLQEEGARRATEEAEAKRQAVEAATRGRAEEAQTVEAGRVRCERVQLDMRERVEAEKRRMFQEVGDEQLQLERRQMMQIQQQQQVQQQSQEGQEQQKQQRQQQQQPQQQQQLQQQQHQEQQQQQQLENRKRLQEEKALRIAAEVNKRVEDGRQKLANDLEGQRMHNERQRTHDFTQRLQKEEELGRQLLEFRKNVAAEAHKRVHLQSGGPAGSGGVLAAGLGAGSSSRSGRGSVHGDVALLPQNGPEVYTATPLATPAVHRVTAPAAAMPTPRGHPSARTYDSDSPSRSAVTASVTEGRKVDYL